MYNKGLKYFGISTSVFLIAFAIVLSLTSKGDTVFFINKYGNESLDLFFKYYTDLGLGIVLAILALVFLFIRYYYSILFALALIGSGIFTYLFKQLLFPGFNRPTGVFSLEDFHRIVQGVEFATRRSFPSGHTMTAFAMAAILAIYFNNKKLGVLLAVFAVSIGFSRMYLLQHFLMDVTLGAIIGTLMVYFLKKYMDRYFSKFSGSLMDKFKKQV